MSWKSSLISVIQLKFWNCEAGCSQSAVSKHVNRKLSGRKKMHNQPREPQPYEDCQENQFKNLGERHKEWTEAGVKTSRAPHTNVSRNLATVVFRGVLPGLREEELNCCLFSSFQMRASFVFHLETKVLESGGRVEKLKAQVTWSPVLSFHSRWWFGCNVICWCWSLKQKEPLPSIEYIYSKWTYFPEGQQFTKNLVFLLVKYEILYLWLGLGDMAENCITISVFHIGRYR